MNKSKRFLSVLMTVVMLLSLMTGMFTVSAAEALTTGSLLVDDDFAGKAAGSAVSATVAGKTYNAVMGKTAFATIQDAVKASKENDTILVAAGEYRNDIEIPHSLQLIGNQKDVDPNDATDLSKRSDKRSLDNLTDESVLFNCVISYANYGLKDKDGNAIAQSGNVTVNGFALTGASTVTLQNSALSNATVEIACLIAKPLLDAVYDAKVAGTAYTSHSVFQINDAASFSDIVKKLVIRNNRIESVEGTTTTGIRCYFTNELLVEKNYIANTTGQVAQINAVTGKTNVIGNYLKNASSWQLCNGIGGEINVKNNTFDGLGGQSAAGSAAFLLYSDGSQTYRNWTSDAVVTVSENRFIGTGKAMNIYSKVLNNQNVSVNGPIYGLTIEKNYLEPVNKQDFSFIAFNNIATHVNDNPVTAEAPILRYNYTGGENPVPLVSLGMSDAGAEINFGPYYLDKEMTVDSTSLELQSVVSPVGATLSKTPHHTIASTVPNEETELKIVLKPALGTSYELFTDADCTIPLANDTLPLVVGANSCYAKVTMGDYQVIYTISVVRKAAFSIPLPSGELMVSPTFASSPIGSTVYQEIGGQTYRATIGLSAFGTVAEAIANQQPGDVIRLAAGIYPNELSIATPTKIVGPKAGINPNTVTWDLSDERANPAEEAIFTNSILFIAGGNNVYLDGISLIEGGCFRSADAASNLKNINISNVRQYDITTATHGFFYRINGGQLNGLTIDQCRVEGLSKIYAACISAVSNLTVKNSGFIDCAKEFRMGSNKGGAASTIAFINNGFINCDDPNVIFSSENNDTSKADSNFLIKGNLFKNCDGNYKVTILGITQDRNVEIVENELQGCASTKNFANLSLHSTAASANIKINRNIFPKGNYKSIVNSTYSGEIDVSKNYYGEEPKESFGTGASDFLFYPYYSDLAMKTLVGAAEILAVNAPAKAVFNAEAKTINFSNIPDDSFELDLSVTDGATWTLYSDSMCTNEIEGTTIRLTGSTTKVYLKVENNAYATSNVYTITINNPINSKAELFGFISEENVDFTTTDGTNFFATVPNRSAYFNLQADTSYGAKFSVYSDAEMKTPLNYTELFVPLGETTFYVKVVSEDKSATKKYTVTLGRGISDATDLFLVTNSEESTWDGNTLVAKFLHDTREIVPQFKLAGGASYDLCKDFGGNILMSNDTPIALETGDNIIYVKVTAEDGVTSQVYRVNLFRMNRSSEKSILATSIPEYTRSISNIGKRVDIFLADFLSSMEVNLDVSPTATYSIFKNYNPVTGECSGSVSRLGAVQPIALVEGDNVFYIRLTAEDNSVAVYTLTIHNEIRSREAFILDAPNANSFTKIGDGKYRVLTGNATTAIDLSISPKAKAYVYADPDHKVELESETTSTVDTTTGLTTTTATFKLNAQMRYITYYVVIESQIGNRENYVVVVRKDGIVPAASLVDISDHWASGYIKTAYTAGIVSGTQINSEVYFEPNKSATREQTAMFLLNLIGVNPDAYTGNLTFKDASKVSNWALPAVRAINRLGIMKGDTNGTFRPKDTITRQEFMVVMAQVCDYDLADYASYDLTRFKDYAKIGSWAVPYVKACVSNGIISGNPDGTLNPKGAITRAEMVTIMAQCYTAVRR